MQTITLARLGIVGLWMATPVFANATPKPVLAVEQEAFFNQLAAHCGKAFAGKVLKDPLINQP
ncbi:hypothetical protein [Shewanella xiamenensis]|uniref:hypothetical protein n=1 Tax=Shewanella xiamenensis TaxID=332186 RepID=UPI001CC72C33|nr:hypothetical protein [Shewanella xiamenensis]BDA62572.1 hypothetical protein NUITMVS1_40350 [Shewanella xiamenensis]